MDKYATLRGFHHPPPAADPPEDGQSERPQHQRPSQAQLRSLSHDVLTAEDEGGVQAAEDKRRVTVRQKQSNGPLKAKGRYFCRQYMQI